jgi:rubrerythrin
MSSKVKSKRIALVVRSAMTKRDTVLPAITSMREKRTLRKGVNDETRKAFEVIRAAATKGSGDEHEGALKKVAAGVAPVEEVVDCESVTAIACLDCGQLWLSYVNVRSPRFCPGCGGSIERFER